MSILGFCQLLALVIFVQYIKTTGFHVAVIAAAFCEGRTLKLEREIAGESVKA